MTEHSGHSPRPAGWRLWLLAARPRTLTISVAPVLAGSALAVALGHSFRPLPMMMALLGAVLIQIGTNLHNDLADALRGGDGPQRSGPPRVTALGWIAPQRVRDAALLCFALATLVGLALATIGGWPIIALGAVSLVAGWAYSGGPRPISYTPLGEAFVIAFFGIGAVAGSAWLQAPVMPPATVILGVAIGLPAAAVLMANNYRDAESDRAVGRRTLAIVLGPAASRTAYAVLMLLPFVLLMALPSGAWAGLVALPLALASIRAFRSARPGPAFNRILATTAQMQMVLAVACAAGLMVTA